MDKNELIRFLYRKGYIINESGQLISPKGKIRKTYINKYNRYHYCSIRINGKVFSFPIHRLAAFQKYGEKLFEQDCVRHLDGNSLNNALDNIEIVSWSDNMMDIPRDIRIAKSRNAFRHLKGYRDEEEVNKIKEYKKNHSYKETIKRFKLPSMGSLWYKLKHR